MSTVAYIRETLKSDSTIIVVWAPEKNYLPENTGGFCHVVEFYVAPKVDGIYTADNLQTLMMSLIPGLKPTQKDDFQEFDYGMRFGKLYFDEEIGAEVVRREIVLTDKDMFLSNEFHAGKHTTEHKRKLVRRTLIRLFPDIQTATAALTTKNEYYVHETPSLRQKMKNFLIKS